MSLFHVACHRPAVPEQRRSAMSDSGWFEQEPTGNGAGLGPLFARLPPVEFGGQELVRIKNADFFS